MLWLYSYRLLFCFLFVRFNLKKLTYDERKQKLIDRLNALNAAAGANDDSDDEDDEWRRSCNDFAFGVI